MLRTPFQIVLGIHDATPVPAAARAHGFTHRFALVQSTRAPGVADVLVDSSALLVLLRALDTHFASIGRLYWDRAHRRRERIELGTLAIHYRDTPQEEHETLVAGEWQRSRQLLALLHTEQWSASGGPAPYHDSLTYSFYSATDLSELLLGALHAADCEPTAVLRADPSIPSRPARGWADTGFIAALVCLLLTVALAMGAELLDISPQVDRWLDLAGACLAGPLALALVYTAGYLVVRRGKHPFTK